jgi:uncharacterized cupredoxin-like copper-binding protein
MRVAAVSLAALSLVAVLAATPVLAEGNLAAKGVDLPELKIDTAELKFSQNEYDLETGKYYRLKISSDGGDEISFMAPQLWSNAWINSVSIDDVGVEATGLQAIAFDDEGSAEIAFVPIRPGEYEFYSPGYENKGLKGKFVVK